MGTATSIEPVLTAVTVQFTLALALAFLIERLLEILKSGYDLLDSRMNWSVGWTKRTEWLRDRLEKEMRVFEYMRPEAMAAVLRRVEDLVLNKQGGYAGTVPVLSGDLVRMASVRLIAKVLGCLLGVGLVWSVNIDFLAVWRESEPEAWKELSWAGTGKLLTGIAVGLGSGSVHKLITTLEKWREEKRSEAAGA